MRYPATERQKKLIFHINYHLGIPKTETQKIVANMTVEEADNYIKTYLPKLNFRRLSFEEMVVILKSIKRKVLQLKKVL